jgi:fluoride ion exporter CrcB/FEX
VKLNPPLRAIWLAFFGGALGSVARYLVALQLSTPITLLVVNLLGAGFLGYVNGASGGTKPRFATAESKWFWGAGFAGGFTTMSGLAMAFILLNPGWGVLLSVVYLVGQMVLGIGCYLVGFRLGRGAWPSV